MAVASYLTDVTEAKHRAKRFGLTSGLFTVGTNIGKALAGPIKVHLGFIYNFIFGLVVTLVAMGYVYFIVPDSFKVREARLKKEREENGQSNAKELVDLSSLSVTEKFRTLFQVKNLKAGATALLRKRDNNMRFYLILMVVCFELEMFLSIGNYLYLRRVLDFTLLDLTRLHTFGGVVALFSQFIMIPILSEKLKLHDSTIVLIDTGTNFIRTLILVCHVKFDINIISAHHLSDFRPSTLDAVSRDLHCISQCHVFCSHPLHDHQANQPARGWMPHVCCQRHPGLCAFCKGPSLWTHLPKYRRISAPNMLDCGCSWNLH